MSWNDAQAYIAWLNKQTGEQYRLPTEAEWEYAARAGSSTARYWGEDANKGCGYANGADQTAQEKFSDWTVAACRDGYVYTAPVGQFKANNWNLHDMLGNVWEWTCSEYDKDYGGAESQCIGKNNANTRALRGGSWSLEPRWLRSALRSWDTPDARGYSLGFRLARSLRSKKFF